jgi:cell division septation protein DedD
MLSNDIKKLLDIHSRVIVPDLGAFMLKGDSTIYFNEFLKFNDGLLVDYIAEQGQIDKTEAAKKVKKFVEDINKQLANEKSANLEVLGILVLDENEKIQLRTSGNIEVPDEQAAMPQKDAPLIEIEDIRETKAPEPPAPIPAPPLASQPKEIIPPLVQEKVSPVSPPPVIVEKKSISTQTSSNDPLVSIESTTNRKMFIVGGLGIIILGVLCYFVFYHHPKNDSNLNQNIIIGSDANGDSSSFSKVPIQDKHVDKTKTTKKIKTELKKDHPLTSQKGETKDKSKALSTVPPQTEKVPAAHNARGKFHLIAGTFTVEANADRMITKLKEEGYQPEKLHQEVKNVYYVSISAFKDRPSATEEMEKLKTQGKATWIYAY